ncbi:MAG: polyprenyl synthetase family protein [Chloroflexota bacterium]|nr:polyprenyl synthetase family protein [Chloroflexota bacterium]MEC8749846.1 polyprenyl synthetase family protein [Chloroflexota bacterium]
MNINNDFEEYLLNLVSVNEVELYRIIKYQLGWEDEGGNKIENLNPKNRKFSNLTLKISKIFGDDLSKSFPFAASVEILASSWYVHGDVQSGITDRFGRPSVWWKWGPAQSINTGDGLHALARLSLLKSDSLSNEALLKALSIFDNSYLMLCEGENLDINYQESPIVKINNLLDMMEKRPGSLYGCCFQLGYLSMNSNSFNDNDLEKLNKIGTMVGLLEELQEQNSILTDENLEPEVFHRFASKKKNIFTSFILEDSDPSIKRVIGEIYFKRVLEEPDLDIIKKTISENKNYLDFYNNLVNKYKNEIENLINNLEFDKEIKSKLKILSSNET